MATKQPSTRAPQCRCGCGQTVTSHKNGIWSQWLSGHSRRGLGGYRGGSLDSNGNLILAVNNGHR